MFDKDEEVLWSLPAIALGVGGGVWFGWQHWWLATLLGALAIPSAAVLCGSIGPFRTVIALAAYGFGYALLSDGANPGPIWVRHLLALPVGLAFLFQQALWELVLTILGRGIALLGLASVHVAAAYWLWHAGYELAITGLGAASFFLSVLLRGQAAGAPMIAFNLLVAWLCGLLEIVAGVVLRLT